VSDGSGHKGVVLILAREFATRLATPMFIGDAEGRLIFYNEPAERVIGRSFAEGGELGAEAWGEVLQIEDLDGNLLSVEERPSGVALLERRASHRVLRITGLDGIRRVVSVTAFPLFARADELVGVVLIVWEGPDGPG
jgi:PAS domain-containing protein